MDEEVQPEEPKFVPVPLRVVNKIPATTDTCLVTGGPNCGKTQYLVNRISQLTEQSANSLQSPSILVFCASAGAVSDFQMRLKDTLADSAVTVTTPRSFALQVLASDDARAYTGRDARMLAPFEMNFLMEDMKVLGMDVRRLREMTRFLFRSLSELGDDDEAWLINNEEETMFTRLKTLLAFYRGIAEPELVNLCVNYLREKGTQIAGVSFDYVLVDDYQLLSRASQYLANMLAQKSLWITADLDYCEEVMESYPHLSGVDEFTEVNEGAVRVNLTNRFGSQAVTGALNALQADAAVMLPAFGCAEETDSQQKEGSVQALESQSPAEEMRAIAKLVAQRLDAGETVQIACPNGVWEKNVAKVLSSAGIERYRVLNPKAFNGDIRDFNKSAAARVLTALELVTNPFDCVAWRSWCGFGSYTANADGMAALLAEAENQHMALDGMLDWATATDFSTQSAAANADLEHIKSAYKQAIELITQSRDLPASELVSFVVGYLYGKEAPVPAAISNIVPASCASGDRDGLFVQIQNALSLGELAFNQSDAVWVGTFNQLSTRTVDTIIFAGSVNGLIPDNAYFDLSRMSKDDQERYRKKALLQLRGVAGKAGKNLFFTWFSETSLEHASQADLKMERIRVRDGQRVVRTSQSIFSELLLQGAQGN